ncbi:UAA transporter family-domain-containing protein [Boletus edulis BED1]|uniref:UDP-galactose transporter homolog 1 n=1 Tax=Boletus edulis BED1 TaxID=1328754 RepID=A0AAD4BVL1_BOLED|nr:UAA transporter family-domain-containing protein [Boletus edulis BED1]
MALLRLGLCVTGVYAMFLLWAIAQERLSVPFQSIDGTSTHKFKSALFIGTCQSFLSSLSAMCYIYMRGKPGTSFSSLLGLDIPTPVQSNGSSKANGTSNTKVFANGHSQKPRQGHSSTVDTLSYRQRLLLGYLQCSSFIALAAPFGFAALSYITYPTMVLGKSCKLVPVMLMNFLLYRRKFAPHKYLVVALVTTGISVFMFFGNEKPSKGTSNKVSDGPQSPYLQLIGVAYLLVNLIFDGVINSTQDELFTRYKVSGQQMMFWINAFCTVLTTALGTLPLPYIPVLHPSSGAQSEFSSALEFIQSHPSVVIPLLQFSLTGALGQLFIFETLQHFGSLTLVTITLTRKMFTMILSVVVYNHKLTVGQWLGAAIVFAGISVEAFVKRKDVHAKQVVLEKEKAKIKSL